MQNPFNILEFYTVHRGRLVGYVKTIVGDEAHAEDIVQEAYIRFSAAAQERTFSEPLAYLYQIVRNLSIDLQRQLVRDQNRLVKDADSALALLQEASPSVERDIMAKQDLETIKELLDTLPKRSRIAFEMHHFGNCTYKQIAEHLDISIGTAHHLVAQVIETCSEKISLD